MEGAYARERLSIGVPACSTLSLLTFFPISFPRLARAQIGDGTLRGFSSFEEHPTEEARTAALEVRCPPSEGAGAGKRLLTPTELAESALTAFLRIIVDVNNANTDGCLTSYRKDPRVIERFGRDFKVRSASLPPPPPSSPLSPSSPPSPPPAAPQGRRCTPCSCLLGRVSP